MRFRFSFIQFVLIISTPVIIISQSRVGDWKSYTSVLDVREAIEVDDEIVCATTGGILIFNQTTQTFKTLTNIDGLVETDLASISLDKEGNLWTGSAASKGVVVLLDLDQHKAIKTFDFNLTGIIDIATSDSVAFVAYSENLDFGILKFIWKDNKFIYKERYYPSLDRLEYISDIVVIRDSLYVATDIGLFVGNHHDNLNYPDNWGKLLGFEDQPITRMKLIDDKLFIIDDDEIRTSEDSLISSSNIVSSLRDITENSHQTLFGITDNKLIRFNINGEVESDWMLTGTAHKIITLSDDRLLISTSQGISIWNNEAAKLEKFVPNSPVSNIYSDLIVLDDGRLVAVGKGGVSILSEDGWYNIVPSYTKNSFSQFNTGDFSRFLADTAQYISKQIWSVVERDDRIYFSIKGVEITENDTGKTIGGGIISFNLNDPSDYVVYDTSNSGLGSYANQYCLKGKAHCLNIRGIYVDGNSNLWISNYGAIDYDMKISVFTPNNKWFHLSQYYNNDIKLNNPTSVIVMEPGVALVGSSLDDGLFIIKYDETDFLDDSYDESNILDVDWTNFSNDLISNTVWSMVSNELDAAWALTANGLQKLNFKNNYKEMSPDKFVYFRGVPFGEGSKMISDNRSNLWISSITDGLYVLLENSTPWPDWEGFTHNNSYLLSDEVTGVAIDEDRGIAYIATSKGINSLKIPFSTPIVSYSDVVTYPSPFRIPSEKPMVVDGLKDNSSLKIMTLYGHVLRYIPSSSPSVSGYQAFWDGKTDNGEYVGTGVYLLGIYSEFGDNTVIKIAVIRE